MFNSIFLFFTPRKLYFYIFNICFYTFVYNNPDSSTNQNQENTI